MSYKSFNPSLKSIKDLNGKVLMEPYKIVNKWQEYFIKLLNANIPANPNRRGKV